MDSFVDILPSTHITDSLSNHISPPACRNVAALKLDTPREPLTIWGENIVVQWADKDNHLRSIVDGSPGAGLSAVLHQLWSQSQTLTDQLLPRFRPAYSSGRSDSAFRLLEYFEARIVEDTMQALMARHPTQSLVWLHDGFLIAPPPTENVLRQIEKAVLSRHQLHSEQTWFKLTPLEAQYEEYVGDLRHTASAPALALARRMPQRHARKQHAATGLAQTCSTPLGLPVPCQPMTLADPCTDS